MVRAWCLVGTAAAAILSPAALSAQSLVASPLTVPASTPLFNADRALAATFRQATGQGSGQGTG